MSVHIHDRVSPTVPAVTTLTVDVPRLQAPTRHRWLMPGLTAAAAVGALVFAGVLPPAVVLYGAIVGSCALMHFLGHGSHAAGGHRAHAASPIDGDELVVGASSVEHAAGSSGQPRSSLAVTSTPRHRATDKAHLGIAPGALGAPTRAETQLTLLDSAAYPAATCVVCGSEISAGEGITGSFVGQVLRFKCPGCLARFEADPAAFLAGQGSACCGGMHDHSPASEWDVTRRPGGPRRALQSLTGT